MIKWSGYLWNHALPVVQAGVFERFRPPGCSTPLLCIGIVA